jgi:phytanoyl-CoA hydroxylase
MKRFIVLSHPRSGSTLLVNALQQHPRLRVHNELLTNTEDEESRRRLYSIGGRFLGDGDDEAEFLKHVFSPLGDEVGVGFKLMHHHARGPRSSGRDFLRADRDLHVIHLRRDDYLACLVSEEVALRTGIWNVLGAGEPPDVPPFALGVEECRATFEKLAGWHRAAREEFANQPWLEVGYGSLTRHFDATLARVFEFVGVEPAPVEPRLQKLARRSPKQQLSNFDELQAAFHGTEFARFFGMGFEGYVDRIEDGWVAGWAFCSFSPDEPVDVQLSLDGTVIGTWTADLYRPDLEAAGKGNGRHAFEIALGPHLAEGATRELAVVFAESGEPLIGSPRTIASSRNQTPAAESEGRKFRSRFGGLWPDRKDAHGEIADRLSRGTLTPADAAAFEHWIQNGFVVLPRAVPLEVIDALDAEVESVWQGRSSLRCFVEHWQGGQRSTRPAGPEFRDQRVKLLDLFAHSENARQIVFAPAIVRFLTLLFDGPLLAFQSLYFRWGSRQDIHQDTAFVRVSSPLSFAASWVALEDIQPDSGELEYFVGSHTLEDYLFEGQLKWMPFRSPEYDAFIESLRARSVARGLERQRFLPKKGDVLIWNAELAHGGRKDVREGITRKSLVTHYCPADCEPMYGVPTERRKRLRFSEDAEYSFALRG